MAPGPPVPPSQKVRLEPKRDVHVGVIEAENEAQRSRSGMANVLIHGLM